VSGSAGPAGSWAARVGRPRGTTSVVVHFTPQGEAFLLSGGAGRWSSTGPGRFRFSVAEAIVDDGADPAGFSGWVRIEQEAVLSADGFESSGTSTVHDAAGEPAYRADITIVARRAA
jgi:hypothetical protein